ncbi:MAG: hypothetical protein QG612_2034 [Pseudomonadota bacterium]|nr:hypothetical protein [Pseudomonadota bacterium]
MRLAGLVAAWVAQSERPAADIAAQADLLGGTQQLQAICEGREALSLDHAGALAEALGRDPRGMTALWLSEDEHRLISNLRRWLGVPFLSCLDPESHGHMDRLMQSLRRQHERAPSVH